MTDALQRDSESLEALNSEKGDAVALRLVLGEGRPYWVVMVADGKGHEYGEEHYTIEQENREGGPTDLIQSGRVVEVTWPGRRKPLHVLDCGVTAKQARAAAMKMAAKAKAKTKAKAAVKAKAAGFTEVIEPEWGDARIGAKICVPFELQRLKGGDTLAPCRFCNPDDAVEERGLVLAEVVLVWGGQGHEEIRIPVCRSCIWNAPHFHQAHQTGAY